MWTLAGARAVASEEAKGNVGGELRKRSIAVDLFNVALARESAPNAACRWGPLTWVFRVTWIRGVQRMLGLDVKRTAAQLPAVCETEGVLDGVGAIQRAEPARG